MSSKKIKKYEKDFKIKLKKQKNNMGIDIIKKLNGNELKINKNILNNIDILKEKLKINLKKINKLNYNNKFYKNQVENIFNKFKNDNNLIKFS
jgi:chromatin segregation and condensation protein Rec8/ScpA/Scc1 (kleisin family)